MGEHASSGAAEMTEEPGRDEGSDLAVTGLTATRIRYMKLAVVFGSVAVVAVSVLVGWLGFRVYDDHRASTVRDEFVAAARQGAVNLTTIDAATAESDVQRVLDSATGTFHDDFQNRAQPFIEVVKKAQSKSEGAVTAAALESQDGEKAEVLVTVSMTMTTPGTQEQTPQLWRMRMSVERVGGTAKISNVQFVT